MIVGSSQVHRGVFCQEEFYRRSENDTLSIYRIFWTGNQLKLFHNHYKVFDRLLEVRPNAVLFEADMLFMQMYRKDSKKSPVAFRQHNYLKLLKRFFFNQKREIFCINPVNHRTSDFNMKYMLGARSRDLSDSDFLHPIFMKMRDSGIALYTLELPRPEQINEQYESGSLGAGVNSLKKEYTDVFGFNHLEYDEIMDLEYFEDHAHLNQKGQARYSQWLYDQVIKIKR